MRPIVLAIAVLMFVSRPAFAAPDPDLKQQYLAIYLEINNAEQLEHKKDLAAALKDFLECYGKLRAIHAGNPDWETALVLHRLDDVRAKIIELQDKKVAGADTISTKETLAKIDASFPDKEKNGKTAFPWKTNVAVDLFYIGKDNVKRSAWDDDWVKSNGGVDAPDERNGYSSAGHAAKLNPFYVALPFNDLAHPDLAKKWIPAGWNRPPQDGKPVSACKDRWVQIKTADGRICYAQWEDVGPNGDADPDYVFGDSRPKAADKPSLSVSPAVGAYLDLLDNPKRVSWRFVDEENLPPGAWLKYDEQAIIYAAMNE